MTKDKFDLELKDILARATLAGLPLIEAVTVMYEVSILNLLQEAGELATLRIMDDMQFKILQLQRGSEA